MQVRRFQSNFDQNLHEKMQVSVKEDTGFSQKGCRFRSRELTSNP